MEKNELELLARKESYSFYRNELVRILEEKEKLIEKIYKRLKILKNGKEQQQYKIEKKKYEKEKMSAQTAKEKIYILTEWLAELK